MNENKEAILDTNDNEIEAWNRIHPPSIEKGVIKCICPNK